jgi:hypothetical protein
MFVSLFSCHATGKHLTLFGFFLVYLCKDELCHCESSSQKFGKRGRWCLGRLKCTDCARRKIVPSRAKLTRREDIFGKSVVEGKFRRCSFMAGPLMFKIFAREKSSLERFY